jgi:hypothetical protein
MDLLTSSGSSVTIASAAGKVVGSWAVRRPFGGVNNGRFAVSMGTVGRGGRIRRSRRHVVARMGVVGEGAQGFWSRARGGGEKVSTMLVSIGMMCIPEFFHVGRMTPYFSMKKYGNGRGMMLVCY